MLEAAPEAPRERGTASFDDEAVSYAFNNLKPFCLDLLNLVQNPKKSCPTLGEMADFLRRTPADALQPCLDYTLFPLLLLLDAAILCRSSLQVAKENESCAKPRVIGDRVAEGVLVCLEELLRKCYFGSVNQMVVVLKKLASGAALSSSEASEEFREGIICCFRALLLRIYPCSVVSCPCKRTTALPACTLGAIFQTDLMAPFESHTEADECLLAFLQSHEASPAVGHWLSLLLQAAEIEAARGLHGSRKLRKEAILTLRVLVAKVGTADALAFFLPGVVSQFTKILYVSKTLISGAAGSVETLEHVVRGLSEFLIVVLGDEANRTSLENCVNEIKSSGSNDDNNPQSILFTFQHLSAKVQVQQEKKEENSIYQPCGVVASSPNLKDSGSSYASRSFSVLRSKEWLEETSTRVDKILAATFPHLCVHPAKKVRKGLLDSIRGLISKCSYTLKRSKLMFLECLCILVCDDSVDVSPVAQEFLQSVLRVEEKYLTEDEVAETFSRLLGKLPKVLLGNEESTALSFGQRLLALMYHAGPQLVVDHLLLSPVSIARLMDALTLSLSHNSVFSGSFDKLILAKQNSVGYLHSVEELRTGFHSSTEGLRVDNVTLSITPVSGTSAQIRPNSMEVVPKYFEIPRMPPWFVHNGDQKLYQVFARMLRLVGLSTMADQWNKVPLSILIDHLLDNLHRLISELRIREYSKENWHSWYLKSDSGHLLRQASTTACVLNEIIFGTSDKCIELFGNIFCRFSEDIKFSDDIRNSTVSDSVWKVFDGKEARVHLIDCVALHQVLLDGIGIFSMTLGRDFLSSGFLHKSLYLLLENLICSSYQIRSTADVVLHMFSASCGHSTVGELVLANADYIIDSLCRQLRHLDLNPHVADVLTATLSFVGVVHEILPLLEEPMRAVSVELEVLGRHQHPELTIPFLKAVSEIAKACKIEASTMSRDASAFLMDIECKLTELEQNVNMNQNQNHVQEKKNVQVNDIDLQLEHWSKMLHKLNESRRYRRTIASIAGSCLTAATPLLASINEAACLVALGIVEDGIATLAKVEEAFRYEKESKEAIGRAIRVCTYQDVEDDMDMTDEGVDENRLLPAMNKAWPYLVICVKNRNLLAVQKCMGVVSKVVFICGGDFFIRRFCTDGSHFWSLLTTSPFHRRPVFKEKKPLLLPYRVMPESQLEPRAEGSTIKVQSAVLNMIAEISINKRSSSAFQQVLKKVSGLVVGIACSSVTRLREASINALSGLACMDPDLIWLLLADVYYSLNKKFPSPPSSDFPDASQLLPPPLTPKDYLYVQYGGESFGFDVDPISVEVVFDKLQSEIISH
ncbi:hypothetical protein H6P81_019666 [Aristolochia fimbriata]|uniref:TTI1 N-terminal TPR domain-containing protein n=1 Tax=Aristolochia fimbriata TaxID=158543 RepID=A0AAV7DVB5_ARIFI|nr:hypothetical protein H6P81_019666 [Aristolochia fimbriata]